MRILHVNKYLHRRGGAETYADDLAQLQHVAGHEVTFFGMRHPDNETYKYERSFPSRVELDPPRRSPAGKARWFGRTLWSTSAASGIDEVLADFEPDIVHLHNIYHQLSPSVLRPIANRGIPAVMTLHDYKLACPTHDLMDHGKPCTACITGGPKEAVRRRCHGTFAGSVAAAVETSMHRMLRAYAPVHRFLCPSWFLADVMRSAGIYPERMAVQDGFVDTAAITPSHLPGEGAAYVGPLTERTGVDVLIEAWHEVPNAQLHIAGDGPARADLERLAEDLVPGRVTFHGSVDEAKVHDLMRGTAVTVLPSISHENQPHSVLEAFACGRPVVGTRLGGVPELIDEDIDGAVVPAADAAALAAALAPLVRDVDRAAAMGEAARAKAERRFAPGAHAAAIEQHYLSVRSRAHGQGAEDASEPLPADHSGGVARSTKNVSRNRTA